MAGNYHDTQPALLRGTGPAAGLYSHTIWYLIQESLSCFLLTSKCASQVSGPLRGRRRQRVIRHPAYCVFSGADSEQWKQISHGKKEEYESFVCERVEVKGQPHCLLCLDSRGQTLAPPSVSVIQSVRVHRQMRRKKTQIIQKCFCDFFLLCPFKMTFDLPSSNFHICMCLRI